MYMDSVGPTRRRERQGAVRRSRVHRMVDVFEEAASGELRKLGLAVGLHHLGHRDTVLPQRADDLVAGALRTPHRDALVDEVVVLAPPVARRQRWVGRPVWQAERVTQPHPLLIGGDGDGN